MSDTYRDDEIRDVADDAERDLLKDDLFPALQEALPTDGNDEEQYRVVELDETVPSRPPYLAQDELDKAAAEYTWPALHDADRVPFGVGSFPQYFVATADDKCAQVYDGGYVAAIDHVLKYVAVDDDFQDNKGVVQALYGFAVDWEDETAVRGAYHNPYGENVDLDTVKFLDDLPIWM